MTNAQIESIVAEYDKMIAGDNASSIHRVTDRTDIGDGVELVTIAYYDNDTKERNPDTTTMVVYDTGDVFCSDDWEKSPQDRNTIGDYDWVHVNTCLPAIVFKGLPRILI